MKNSIPVNLLFGTLLLFFSCTSGTKEESAHEKNQKPNIILIMADDLGYGELSSYGSKTVKTPNIDKLASQGVKFLDFHANGPVCSPTRAALMTGKYQQRTGVEGIVTAKDHRDVGLSLNETTIAEELKNLGYTTAMYGKWHLGYEPKYNPTNQGFDEYTGFVSGNIDYHSHVDQEGYLDWWQGTNIENEPGYTTDLLTSYSVNYIKNNNPEITGKPFFLYLAQEAPHDPIQGRDDEPVRNVGSGKSIRDVSKEQEPAIYKEMIEILDESVGEIMKTVKNEGLDKSTIIIFCSDNGGVKGRGNCGILREYKKSVYEGGHRVPAVIRYTDTIEAGRVSNESVLSMDFLPTLVDFANAKPTGKNIDGISIKKHLIENEALTERDLFWSYDGFSAIRSGNWKLVEIPTEGENIYELYNLESDLSEENNLTDKHQDKVKELVEKLNNWKIEVRKDVVLVSN